MPRGSWVPFDHTADLGVEVRAPTLPDLFETAADALFQVLMETKPGPASERVELPVRAEGADLAELLVRWLSELLYLHDARGLVLESFSVTSVGPRAVEGRVSGAAFDPSRHQRRTELKAVTYHQARVEPTAGGWEARVIFDV